MRYVFAILLILVAQQTASAELLVGTTFLRFQHVSKYQPGSCAEQTLAKAHGEFLDEICMDMTAWGLYEAVEFRDLKGQVHAVSPIVANTHLVLSSAGEWLLVLEKLSDDDAVKFGARYKVIDRAPIMPIACLAHSIDEYTKGEAPTPKFPQGEKGNCYDMLILRRK